MSASKILFLCSVAFIGGVLVASLVAIPSMILLAAFCIGVLLAIIALTTKKLPAVAGFFLLCALLGVLRVQIEQLRFTNDELQAMNGAQVAVEGVILSDPEVSSNTQQFVLSAHKSNILVTTNRYPEFGYGDALFISGNLEAPESFDGFDYPAYLRKERIYSLMRYPKVTALGKAQISLTDRLKFKAVLVRHAVKQSIDALFPSPSRFLMKGILLGDNSGMPETLQDQLSAAGVRHLTAVSGTHIIIIASILMSMLLALGLWRFQAFCVAIMLLWMYVGIIGFPASGVRAAALGTIALLASQIGRQHSGGRAIALVAVLMLMENPLLLVFDVGFQLSFLAALGIMYGKPLISKGFSIITQSVSAAGWLMDIISVTFAAQLFTLPLLLYYFDAVSLTAPITNLLILPIVPFLIQLGALAAVLGIMSVSLGLVFAVPCQLILQYFLIVVAWLGQPWAQVSIAVVSWGWLLIGYAVIATVVTVLRLRWSAF